MLLLIVPVMSHSQIKRKAFIPKHKGFVEVVRLNALNSAFNEGNPSVTPDGKYLFFMSERGEQSWSRKKDRTSADAFDGDIWYSENVNGIWQTAACLNASINSVRGEDEPNISFDGRTVMFESWRDGWQQNGGPYYEAKSQGALWSNPVGLGGGINEFFMDMRRKDTAFATDGASFSIDGHTLIFAGGPQYDSDMDIYVSKKDNNGKWSYPKRLFLSTEANERSAFIAADGHTLYFASNGYEGFGGLDIYKAMLGDDGTVRDVINIGEPFNTKGDDYGFALTASGDEAYFVRNGDLYYAKLGKEFDKIKPQPTAMLTGTVKNKDSGVPMESQIHIRELPNGDVINSASNALTGEYSLVLRIGKRYEQTVTAPNFVEFKRVFQVTLPKAQKGVSQRSLKLEFDVNLAMPKKTW